MKRWLERLAVLVAAGTLLTPAFGQLQGQGFGGGGASSYGGGVPQPPQPQGGGVTINNLSGAQGAGASETRPDFTLSAGDTFIVRHASGNPIKDVTISRPGVISLDFVQTGPKNTTLKGTALAPGLTTVTISAYDTAEITTRVVQVVPSVDYIQSLLNKTFPTSNIKLIPGSAANSMIASGTVESAEDVEPVLTFLSAFTNNDRRRVTNALRVSGVMQVQLEVCVARVNRNELRAMGLNFLFADRQNFFGNGVGGVATLQSAGSATRGTPLIPTSTIDLSAASSIPSLQFGITDASSGFLGFLQALRTEGLNKILANPVLVTTSGRVAEFLVGGEQAAAVAGGATSGSTLQYRAFGTRLAFLPFVLGDGRLRLIVLTEVSQPAGTITTPNIVAPNFTVNRVHTAVEMENRQTLILGGIIQNEINATTNKVPVLGDLPFFGAAFRSVSYTENETEVVMMVTASLVDPLDAGQVAGYRLPGQETRSPTDFELFLEGILEAPRGPRAPFQGHRYVAAHMMAAPYGVPQGQCWDGNGGGLCGHGCGGCASFGTSPAAMPVVMQQQQMMPATQIPAPTTQLPQMPLPMPAASTTTTSGMTPPLSVGSRSMVLPNETTTPVAPASGQAEVPQPPPVEPPAPPAPPSAPKD
jgi:pilus assembly protein CpaC